MASASSPRSYSIIQELNSKKSDWKLKVRIFRLWDVESPKKRGFIICTDMVLIDEEGAYVHASLRGEAAPKLRQKLVEGKIYIMKNFEVVPNKDEYRVVSDSKIMLNFQFDTFVKMVNEGENIIPKHRFDFVPFDLLDQRRNNFIVLSDIFGRIVDEFGTDSDKKIEIEDQGGKRVRVKLWSRCSIDYTEQKKKLVVENKLKIVTITSIMARDYNGFLSLAASSASKVYINLDINEVTELKTHIRGNNEDDTIDIPKIHSQDMVCQKMDIQSIIDYCKTEYKEDTLISCTATVTRINTKQPWYYSSCLKCNTKPRRRNSDFWCFRCDKAIESQTIRYRIELCVDDGSGSTIFTLLDKEARNIVGQDAISLYDTHASEVDGEDEDAERSPELLRSLFIGKKFLFKLKITNYNHDPKNRQTFSLTKILDNNIIEIDNVSASEESTLHHKRDCPGTALGDLEQSSIITTNNKK